MIEMKLTKHQIAQEIMKSNYKEDLTIFFLSANDFVARLSIKQFEYELKHAGYCRGLVGRLNILLDGLITIEAYEYAVVIRDYLISKEDVYLY